MRFAQIEMRMDDGEAPRLHHLFALHRSIAQITVALSILIRRAFDSVIPS
jgi:hypothetical protein